MKYILRHKNIDVAKIELQSTGFSIKELTVLDPAHFPYGVEQTESGLREWWTYRNIPQTREGILNYVMLSKSMRSVQELPLGTFGLNLSDQYWLVPEKNAGRTWNELNFFDNDFSDKEGFLYSRITVGSRSILPPDRSTSGNLPKRWIIENGVRYLVKEGSRPYYEEAEGEKIATIVCRGLGINCIDYEVVADYGVPASKCACFVMPDTELVAALEITFRTKKDNRQSYYEHSVKGFEQFGVENARRKIDEMIVLDYLIGNTDRHYYNFGALRNADTLEPLGFAPIFDSGTCFWSNEATKNINAFGSGAYSDIASKPFRTMHGEQIKLVSDFSWFDPVRIEPLYSEIERVMSANEFTEPERIARKMKAFKARVDKLAGIASIKT